MEAQQEDCKTQISVSVLMDLPPFWDFFLHVLLKIPKLRFIHILSASGASGGLHCGNWSESCYGIDYFKS